MCINNSAMKTFVQFLFLFFLLSLTGCVTASYSNPEAKSIAKSSITSKDKFFIAVANEGRYKGIRYKESNVELENAIEKQLSNYVANIICAGHILDLESAKTIAKSKGCSILVFSRILHWEDRATAWSGLSDKIEIRTTIYDLNKNIVLDSFIAEGSSANITFLNDAPSDLLDTPYRRYFDSLFCK